MARALFTLNIERSFFDRAAVESRLDKASHKVLYKFGANVRQTSRKIQKKKGAARNAPKKVGGKSWQKWVQEKKEQPSSRPGQPPFAHSSDPNATLRKVLYGMNEESSGVLVGAALLGSMSRDAATVLTDTVPSLHEHGGSVTITERMVAPGVWVRAHGKRLATDNKQRRKRKARYPKRPFIKPALDANLPKLDGMWKDAMDKVRS